MRLLLRVQQTSRALANLLNLLGVDYGILGHEEHSDGDSQRQTGERGLFEMLAEKNGRAMLKYQFGGDPGDRARGDAPPPHDEPVLWGWGVGCVEAPRGTLTHHYCTDENGVLTHVNLIVSTTNNYAPISMSVKKAAQELIHEGTILTDGILKRIEMAFWAYDPCFACATHTLPGQMPLEVVIRAPDGTISQRFSRRE